MRRHRGIDKGQPEIVRALKAAGASVCDLSGAGEGTPDLLVGFQGRNILMEVKQAPAKGIHKNLTTLRPCQQEFFDAWLGQVAKVTTVEEALALLPATEGGGL
jgi:hypothetical protein